MGGGEEVEYAAAARELARALDLDGAGIAAAQERVLRVRGVEAGLHVDAEGRAAEGLRRHGALKDALGGHYRDARAAHEVAERAEAALLRLARDGVRGDEDVFAPGEHHGPLAREGRDVHGQGVRRGLVRREQHDGRAGPELQRRGKLRPVDSGEPRYERRKAASLPRHGEGGSLRYVEKRLCENRDVHNHCIIPELSVKFNNIRSAPGAIYYYLIKYCRRGLDKTQMCYYNRCRII